jgi:hypothetical protein
MANRNSLYRDMYLLRRKLLAGKLTQAQMDKLHKTLAGMIRGKGAPQKAKERKFALELRSKTPPDSHGTIARKLNAMDGGKRTDDNVRKMLAYKPQS